VTAECTYTLLWVPLLAQIVPDHVRSGPHLVIHGCLLTPVINPNGILIGSAIFAGLTTVTDRPTDHATRTVTIDLHLHT